MTVLVALVATFLGCSSDSSGGHMAGNSAETGTPEIAGLLLLGGETPAARAQVQCVPQNFDATVDSLPETFKTVADQNGYFQFKTVPVGVYALEAFHEESGKRLLKRNINIANGKMVQVKDSLLEPGFANLTMPMPVENGAPAIATVFGTTIIRMANVHENKLLVSDLPADTLSLRIYLENDTVNFDAYPIPSNDTVQVNLDSSFQESVNYTFVAPLVLPEGNDSLAVSDIPIALRLTPENCAFDSIAKIIAQDSGRWEVVRISRDGSRSKKLPIAKPALDTLAQQALFWINVDSLNVHDSLELSYNGQEKPMYANDVFPTNRLYTLVWHFESGVAKVDDAAQLDYFDGIFESSADVKFTEGVVGRGIALNENGFVVADHSTAIDTTLTADPFFNVDKHFCFSLWIKLDSLSKNQTIFEKSREYALRYIAEKGFVFEKYYLQDGSSDSSAPGNRIVSLSTGLEHIVAGKWIYVAFNHFQDLSDSFFINESKIEANVDSTEWDGILESKQDFKVGGFSGELDELMFGSGFRDDSWTLFTYLNQKPVDFWPVLSERP